MNEIDWTTAKRIESSKFPKNSFVGVLKALYPSISEKMGIPIVKVDFESDQSYNMPSSSQDGKFGIHDDGTYDSFMSIGQFLESIESIDVNTGQPTSDPDATTYQVQFAYMDGVLSGIRTMPDILGCTLHNVAKPREVAAGQEPSKFPDWIIGEIDRAKQAMAPAPAPTPAQSPPAHSPPDQASLPDMTERWRELYVDVLEDGPKTSAGILKGVKALIPDQAERDIVNKDKKAITALLIEEGFITLTDGKYSLGE